MIWKKESEIINTTTIHSKIKNYVEKLTQFYSTNDPKKIADYLGIIILQSDLGSIDGFLQLYNHKYIIHLNNKIEFETQQEKVIAHELGHYFLHKHFNVFNTNTHSLSFESSLENEANIFSCELLLNDDMIRNELIYIESMTISEIAAYFNLDEEIIQFKRDIFFLYRKEHTFYTN